MRRAWICVLSACAIVLSGSCRKKSEEPKSSETPARARPEKPRPRAEVLPEADKLVREAAKACKLDALDKCPKFKELAKLRDTQGKELAVFLTEIVLAGDQDPKVAEVAAAAIGSRTSVVGTRKAIEALVRDPGKLPKEALVKAFENMARVTVWNTLYNVAQTYGALAGLYGLVDTFLKVAGKHPKHGPYARRAGIVHFADVAGMKALPVLEQLGDRKGEALSGQRWTALALEAAGNLIWTWGDKAPKEGVQLCNWAQKYLGDSDPMVAEQVGHVMVQCARYGEKYPRALLEAGKKRIAEHPEQWREPMDLPFRDICFESGLDLLTKGMKQAAKEIVTGEKAKRPAKKLLPICKDTYDFLAQVADNPKVAMDMRVRALDWITYQARDEVGLAYMKRFLRHKEKKLREEAKKQIDWLRKSYLSKKK